MRRTPVVALVASVVLLAGTIQLVLGPGATGVTTDEPAQVFRTVNWLDGGDFTPSAGGTLGEVPADNFVYGPAFAAVAHAGNALAGNESWGEVSLGSASTTGRHLAAAAFALLTALICGLTARAATRSRTMGLWAAAAVLAVPLWTGMGFFNPKDTPAAAGYTFFTCALVLGLERRGPGRRPDRRDLALGALAAAGAFFAVGTRLALWLPLLFSLAVYGALVWWDRDPGGRRWAAVLAGGGAGLIAVVAIYPGVFSDPFQFVGETLGGSADYPWTGVTLTAGELLTQDPPRWYLPAWAFASVPLLLGGLALVGAGRGLAGAFRRLRARERRLDRLTALGILALAQAAPLPVGSVLLGSTMYTGLRQHLYLVPAVALLGAAGAAFLLGSRRPLPSLPGRDLVVKAILCLALLVPMAEQLMLYPYNYVYVNPIAGIGGLNDRWEGDYWWASLKEASERVPEGEPAFCADAGPGEPAAGFEPAPCSPLARPYAEPVPPRDPGPGPGPGERLTLARKRAGGSLPGYCRPVENVTRWLRGETVVISYVARC